VMQWGDRTNRRLVTLGGIYEHTVDEAKEWWRQQREQERRGVDLVIAKHGARRELLEHLTVATLVGDYLADESHEWSKSHLDDSRRRGEIVAHKFGALRPEDFTALMLNKLHGKITESGHHLSKKAGVGSIYEADKIRGFVHHLYVWASEPNRGYGLEGVINPAQRRRGRRSKKVKWSAQNGAHKRQRVMRPDENEFSKLLRAADATGNSVDGVIVRLLWLTGLRRKELLLRRWKDVSFEQQVMLIPGNPDIPGSTKNGLDHHMPLCDRAVELLQSIRDPKTLSIDPDALIFTTPKVDPRFGKPITQDFSGWWEDTWRKIRSTADLRCWGAPDPGFRVHDIRRSVSTWLIEYRGHDDTVAGKLLNHTSQGASITEENYHTDLGGKLASNQALVSELQDMLALVEDGRETEFKAEGVTPILQAFASARG
jgi:integrase